MDDLSSARIQELREQFDLSDLSKISLFPDFHKHTDPFENSSEDLHEKLWYESQVKIFERFESGQGQKLGFDPSSETWFYEVWSSGNFSKSWKQRERSWGESVLKDSSGETKETWNFLPTEENYEHLRLEPGNEYGSTSGRKPDLSWKEIWHKKPEDSALEKFWVSPVAKWGEKSGQTAGKDWSLEWREEGDLFEEKSKNAENERTWGHVKGKDLKTEWQENWSAEGANKNNDKWWKEHDKSWGVKSVITATTEFHEEWEEKSAGVRRTVKTYKDENGIETKHTEGTGPGYSFIEDYLHDPRIDLHKTTTDGHSPDGKWQSWVVKEASKNSAKHKGQDLNGEWEEEWEEDGGSKKTLKKGKSSTWGEWEEQWEESSNFKHCRKWGRNHEEWEEEWTEDLNGKKCRKQQKRDGKVFVQQWEEIIGESATRCKGQFFEDDVVVKEWDYLKPHDNEVLV